MLPLRVSCLLLVSAATLLLTGCGGMMNNNCTTMGMTVNPVSATVNHATAAPANSQMFSATSMAVGNGCMSIATAALVTSNWTANDPTVMLSPSPTGQVRATCTASSINPVMISATSNDGRMLSGQASLMCK